MAYGTVNADVVQSSVSGVSLGAGDATMMKNRIINGAMTISQYNGSTSTTPASNNYPIDRWTAQLTQASKFSVQQVTTAPSGFSNSLLFTVVTPVTAGSGDYFGVEQRIEGYNFYDLAWGTASAKPATLSFWVYANNAGTYCGSVYTGGASYVFTYSIPSANTWTYITIPVAASTTYGPGSTTNGAAVYVRFTFTAGSAFSTGSPNTWLSGNVAVTSGAFNWIGTSGATLYITGIQLEVGSSATGFEYRQYGQELALCYRYYEQTNLVVGQTATMMQAISSGAAYGTFVFTTTKRATPTISASGTFGAWNSTASTYNGTFNSDNANPSMTRVSIQSVTGSPLTAGNASTMYVNSATAYIAASAEL